MESEFWHRKWHENQIGFHQEKVNSRLIKHWSSLDLGNKGKVLVPLCGRSEDMLWLADQGHEVLGVELSALACEDFFRLHAVTPEVSAVDGFTVYHHDNIALWAGDFFSLTIEHVQDVVAVYDRAALIALPAEMRSQYAEHLASILPANTETLLITMKYDQQKMKGPPFSVSQEEVKQLYSDGFVIDQLAESFGPDIVGNLKQRGLDTLEETVFRLTGK